MNHMQASTDTFTQAVAGAVRAELGRKRQTVSDLAEALGASRPTVSRRVNGKEPFDLAELEQVAAFLNLSVHDLFESAQVAVDRQAVAS
jgi:transcriptional regulator with XRE-family HTH domain